MIKSFSENNGIEYLSDKKDNRMEQKISLTSFLLNLDQNSDIFREYASFLDIIKRFNCYIQEYCIENQLKIKECDFNHQKLILLLSNSHKFILQL